MNPELTMSLQRIPEQGLQITIARVVNKKKTTTTNQQRFNTSGTPLSKAYTCIVSSLLQYAIS